MLACELGSYVHKHMGRVTHSHAPTTAVLRALTPRKLLSSDDAAARENGPAPPRSNHRRHPQLLRSLNVTVCGLNRLTIAFTYYLPTHS
jgi:hypothetical protein